MERLKGKVMYSLAGIATGLAGIVSVTNCSAGTCSSCFRCAGVGLVVALVAVLSGKRTIATDSTRNQHSAPASHLSGTLPQPGEKEVKPNIFL